MGKSYEAWGLGLSEVKRGKNVPEAPENQEVCRSNHLPLPALILCFIFLQNVNMYLCIPLTASLNPKPQTLTPCIISLFSLLLVIYLECGSTVLSSFLSVTC